MIEAQTQTQLLANFFKDTIYYREQQKWINSSSTPVSEPILALQLKQNIT